MKILFLILMILSLNVEAQTYMFFPIIEITDGDTIKTSLGKRLPPPLNDVSIRIDNIDTPEMPAKSYHETGKLNRAKCVKEAELALKAKELVEWIAQGHTKMTIRNYDWDKYGGRIRGDVSINGVDVAEALIFADLAVEYHGKGERHDWCQ